MSESKLRDFVERDDTVAVEEWLRKRFPFASKHPCFIPLSVWMSSSATKDEIHDGILFLGKTGNEKLLGVLMPFWRHIGRAGPCPVSWAISYGHVSCAKKMLSHVEKVSPSLAFDYKRSALENAASSGVEEMVALLMGKVPLDDFDDECFSPLASACVGGHYGCASLLFHESDTAYAEYIIGRMCSGADEKAALDMMKSIRETRSLMSRKSKGEFRRVSI